MNENQNHREEMSAEERTRARTAFIRRRAAVQTKQINSYTDPKDTTIMNTRTRTVIASVVSIAAALAIAPITTSAIADSGILSFCVQASMENGKYTAVKGLCEKREPTKEPEIPQADPTPSFGSGACQTKANATGMLESVTLTWNSTGHHPASFKFGVVPGARGEVTEDNLSVSVNRVGTTDTYTATIPLNAITAIHKGALGGTTTIGVAHDSKESRWARVELKVPVLGLLLGSSCIPI